MQQVMQLSGVQAWLSLTLLLNEIGNLLIQNEPSSFGAIALVASLTAYPQKMTKHYQEGHGDKTIEYVKVGAELAF